MRADAERNRARVLDAAEEVFEEKGTSASTEEIADRAGVGIGTVFRHFPTKDALLQAILLDRVERLGKLAASLTGSADPSGAFFGFFRRIVLESRTKKTYVDALAAGASETSLAPSLAGQKAIQALTELLSEAQRAGGVRSDIDANQLVAVIAGASRAIEHAQDDPQATERILNVFLDGLTDASPRSRKP
jgi:AcrR family transcriptional regulator